MDHDTSSSTRIAVLIDCDNVSSKHIGAVLEELASYGVPTVKRAYGDWTTSQLTGWKPELLRNAIQRAADDDGWARVSTVGQHIANQSSFDSRNHGYASLTKLLVATQLFDVRDIGKSSMAVRDKRTAKKAT